MSTWVAALPLTITKHVAGYGEVRLRLPADEPYAAASEAEEVALSRLEARGLLERVDDDGGDALPERDEHGRFVADDDIEEE